MALCNFAIYNLSSRLFRFSNCIVISCSNSIRPKSLSNSLESSIHPQCEKNATSEQIMLILQKLEEHFTVKHKDTTFVLTIKEKVWEDLSERNQDEDIQAFQHEATALDFRFKERPVSTWDRQRKASVEANVTEATPELLRSCSRQTQSTSNRKRSLQDKERKWEEKDPQLYKTRSALEKLFSEEDR